MKIESSIDEYRFNKMDLINLVFGLIIGILIGCLL